MRISLDGLAEVVKKRVESPPVIVLMSRSGRLIEQADAFRDGARVFASGFRTIVKADIEKPGRLEQLVRELARHRQDSLKLNSFLLGWSQGITGAMRRTEDDIRRLDLEDWAQIHDLLLESEGSSAGRYILEVLEFSFLHELESENAFLGAAVALVHRLSQSRHSGNLILNTKQRVAPAHGESFVWIGALDTLDRVAYPPTTIAGFKGYTWTGGQDPL